MTETVLTSRRAVLLDGRHAVAGRLRVSDRALRFESPEGARVELPIASICRVARRGRVLVVDTAAGSVRIRCFGVRGVAGLLVHACAG